MNRNLKTQYIRNPVIVTLLAITALISSPALWAQSLPGGYEMSFVANQAHGDLLQEAKYVRATRMLANTRHTHPFAVRTNHCVARAMIGQFREAQYDCRKAVELSEQVFATAAREDRESAAADLATAYSNRGVLHAMLNRQAEAEADFRTAAGLQSGSSLAARNLARLNGTELPQVAADFAADSPE